MEALIEIRENHVSVSCEPGGEYSKMTVAKDGLIYEEDGLHEAVGQAVLFALDRDCTTIHFG
tara:strand:- start:143 stop:328 length:186 start_codon:yes stop_codon:yes gene_type:complete